MIPHRCLRLTRKPWVLAGLLLFAVALWSTALPAEGDLAIIASDGFESGSFQGGSGWATGWNVSSAVSIVTAQHPHDGARHLEVRGSAVASRGVDLSGWASVELGFWARAKSLEAGDFITLEVSPDGTSWEVLETWADGDDDTRYHRYEYDLPDGQQGDTLFIRILSHMDEASDYFYLDAVVLQGEAVPGSEPIIVSPPVALTSVPIAAVASTSAATSGGGIIIDGDFSEWAAFPILPDPPGDASKARGDLSAFYWGNDGDSEVNYWMIERYAASENDEDNESAYDVSEDNSSAKLVKYTVYLDTNNDGAFDGRDDRRVLVDYHPKASHSDVRVRVKRGRGGQVLYSASGDWGESTAEGGLRVEFAVSWNDLGITNGDVTRMYVTSNWQDRLPDSGDIQWSPASILGAWLLATTMAVGGVALWQIRKRRELACRSGLE